MTLTKAELADLLFEKVGLNKREAKDMVEAFFEEIRAAATAATTSTTKCCSSAASASCSTKKASPSAVLATGSTTRGTTPTGAKRKRTSLCPPATARVLRPAASTSRRSSANYARCST